MINMARLKEIMAEVDFCGNQVKSVLVKIPANCAKDQTDIENLEFSIMDLVVMDPDLSTLLKDIFNIGIIFQTFSSMEKVWRDVPPGTKITLDEWSHVKVKLFNNDPETDDRIEELTMRRSKSKTRDPRIKSLPQSDSRIHSLPSRERRDPRRREKDEYDITVPVDHEDDLDNISRDPECLVINTDREVEMRTVSLIQERDPRRKLSQKRDPRKIPRQERDPRKSTSQEKDGRKSPTEDKYARKCPSEERDPRKRVTPAVQLPVITPEKIELPENRHQPLSSFPQKPNKPISKVMPMVMQMDHKDPRRRKRLQEVASEPYLVSDPQGETGSETRQVGDGFIPQQAEPMPIVPSNSSYHSSKASQGQNSGADSDSDDGELKIDIKETEEELKLDVRDCDFSKRILDKKQVAVSKTELLKKLLPHKFGANKVAENESGETNIGLSKCEDLVSKESDENELTEAKKTTVLDDQKKTTGLDDSFGLWDEVYGVTESIENDTSTKNIDPIAISDPVPIIANPLMDDTNVETDPIPAASKLRTDIKEFAKNMVRNTLMRPSKNSPKSIELRKSSQESAGEKVAGEGGNTELIITGSRNADTLINIEGDQNINEVSEENNAVAEVDDGPLNVDDKNVDKENDDKRMKQLEISRDGCRKKIEDLEKEQREMQRRELLLSLEKERDRLNKSIESEDAAQTIADEIEDGEIADTDDEENAKSSNGERNTSMDSPKALEIDEHSPSPSPPQRSPIYVTIRHDTQDSVVRNKPPEIRKGKNLDPTQVPKNPLMRSERRSSDDILFIPNKETEEEKSKKPRSEKVVEGEQEKKYRSEKVKMLMENVEERGSDNSGTELSGVYKKDADLDKRKRESEGRDQDRMKRERKGDGAAYPDRRGESVSEDDVDPERRRKSGTGHKNYKEDDDFKRERRKSGERWNKESKERYPKYWEEFEQEIKSKKPKKKSWSEDDDAEQGMFDEETVWINKQDRSNHWTRKSVQSIISGSHKTMKTGHKPNLDIEVLEIPDDTGAEDFSPNQNFWGSQKRFLPPPTKEVADFTNIQENPDFTNLQEKRRMGSQEELNKRFKRNDWAHFSKAGRGPGGKSDTSKDNPNNGKRGNVGLVGIREIGKGASGMGEQISALIPSLMDIKVSPPERRTSSDAIKNQALTGVSSNKKCEADTKKFNSDLVESDKAEKKCGMEFVESIQKKVSFLAESHKKKMEKIEKINEVQEAKNEVKQVKTDQVKDSRKDSKDDENLFLYFYEGDALLHDEDENDIEILELKDEKKKPELPLPVPCLGKASKKTKDEDHSKKHVNISPIVNRRVVMEEAFGLGTCLAQMKNDQSSNKQSDQSSENTSNKSLINPPKSSPAILPSPVPARGALHVDVDQEEETPKPAPMITPPPPMISQAKWRFNTEMSNPPTKADIYRHTLGLDNKNPIAALHELCQRNKWPGPKFKETEAPGGKAWSFSAFVNGKEFPSSKVLTKKKEARVDAARICLREMGLL